MFDNSYSRLPESFHAAVAPNRAPTPSLIAWNEALAKQLGLQGLAADKDQLAGIFSGVEHPPGTEPIAMAYSGHQFGVFNPHLGDGRASLLGEVVTREGRRFDVQLKGSGRTAFSRRGDGKSWLGPVLREYILSEAMHVLGVPTTRALAAVATGDTVFRESALPGAVFTRVASSHLRVGTFQYFASRGMNTELRTLADYAIDRHYPEASESEDPLLELLRQVTLSQARLVAHWMAIGFIHGVMNTDNTAISGETIDYGPAAYMDEFRFAKKFSSIDEGGRYAYGNQPPIALWNLARFAETLLTLGADKESLEEILGEFPPAYENAYLDLMRPKLGLIEPGEDDAGMVRAWLELLEAEELDYTLSFRELAERALTDDEPRFGEFEARWKARIAQQEGGAGQAASLMNSVNPLYIPRNHRVEEAIAQAVNGDYSVFEDLNTVLAQPFDEQPGFARFALAPEQGERVQQTFCGT